MPELDELLNRFEAIRSGAAGKPTDEKLFKAPEPTPQAPDYLDSLEERLTGAYEQSRRDRGQEQGYLETIGKGLVRGAEGIASGVGSIGHWAGEATGIEPLANAGKWTSEYFDKAAREGWAAPDPVVFKGSFMDRPSLKRAAGIVSEAIPYLAAALFTGGVAAGGLRAAGMAAGAAQKAGAAAGAFGLGALEGAPQYEEARKAGKSIGEASTLGAASTIGTGILEFLPIAHMLKPMAKGGIGKLVMGATRLGGEEAAQEGTQQIFQNAIAKYGYDATRDLTEGLAESIIGGFGSGAIAGTTSSRINRWVEDRRKQGVPDEQISNDIERIGNAVAESMEQKADEVSQAPVTNEITTNADAILQQAEMPEVEPEDILMGRPAAPMRTGEDYIPPALREFTPSGSVAPTTPQQVTPQSQLDLLYDRLSSIKEGKSAEVQKPELQPEPGPPPPAPQLPPPEAGTGPIEPTGPAGPAPTPPQAPSAPTAPQLMEPSTQVETEGTDRIKAAYDTLKAERGIENIEIADIRDKAGVSQEEVDAYLKRNPDAVLTDGDYSVADEHIRSGAVMIDRTDRPQLLARIDEAETPQQAAPEEPQEATTPAPIQEAAPEPNVPVQAKANTIKKAISATPEATFASGNPIAGKVWISDAYAQFSKDNPRTSIDDFKSQLLREHQAGEIELSRADLTQAMDRTKVDASSIKHPFTKAEWNFIKKPQEKVESALTTKAPVQRPSSLDVLQDKHIRGRIDQLGSLEAVKKVYSGDTTVEKYARALAEERFKGVTEEAQNPPESAKAAPAVAPQAVAPEKPTKFTGKAGMAWVNEQQRAITGVREITRGKRKGSFIVTLPNGKLKTVPPGSIIRMPEAAAEAAAAQEAPTTTAPHPEAKAKEPWAMARAEFSKTSNVNRGNNYVAVRSPDGSTFIIRTLDTSKYTDADAIAASHKDYIKKAIEKGLPVPAEVLAEYPDLQPEEAAKAEAKAPKAAPQQPTAKTPKITTLRGAIKAMGGLNFLNLKGEVKSFPPSVRMSLIRTTGEKYDRAEQRLKEEGWLKPDEELVMVLRDKENMRRGMVAGEGVEKREADKTEQEKRVEREMKREPEAPPEGDYIMLEAEDLPEGKKLTIIDDSAEGWDRYEVTEKDPFGVTLRDGRTIELKPGQQVHVRKEDLQEKEQEKAEEPKQEPEKPSLTLQGERQMPKPIAEMRTKGKAQRGAEQGGLEFGTPETPAELTLAGEKVGAKEVLSAKKIMGEAVKDGETTITIPAESEFFPSEEISKWERDHYIKDGGTYESSRKKPMQPYPWKEGAWRIDKAFGPYGRMVEQIRRVKLSDLALSEEDYTKVNFEGRGFDAEQYAQWIKEGKTPPPVLIVESDSGKPLVSDGHRRVAAAKLAGVDTILAWVSPRMDTGKKDSAGKPIYTAATYEGLKFGAKRAQELYEQRLDEQMGKSRAAEKSETKEPWQMTADEYRYAEAKQKFDAIQKAFKEGKELTVATQLRAWKLSKPEHLRLTSKGFFEIPRGMNWDRLGDAQVESLAAQAGFKLPIISEKVFHHGEVEKALEEGKPVSDEVLADYPDLKKEPKPETPAGEKIEDFGEKIGGARKDIAERGYTMTKPQKKETEEPAWRKKFNVVESIKIPGQWTIVEHTKDRWGFTGPSQKFSSKEEAEKAIPLYAVARMFNVRENKAGEFIIEKKIGDRKRLQMVQQSFPSREEGMKYLATHAEELLSTKTSFGEEILPVPDTVERKGAERRQGPATKEMFVETFAPRAIEFGNWNNQEERQLVMNHAYDGLLDLADALEVPPKALMLNGELAIAFGARGQGLVGAKAHYEPDYGVINLTKMKGAGSLAHEWMHAFDHHLARLDTKASSEKKPNERGDLVYDYKRKDYTFQSHGPSYKSKMRQELKDNYNALIETMLKKGEQYVEDTQKADQFLSTARVYLKEKLDSLRAELSRDYLTDDYWKNKRNKKNLGPASAEQLAEFDRLANILVEGGDLKTEIKQSAPKKAPGRRLPSFGYAYRTNATLDAINEIFKAVRGREGFRSEHDGWLDDISSRVEVYGQRVRMFEDAQAGTEKTKQVPTNYAIEARKMDQARVGDYWSEPHEMAARAFASYVEDKIAEKGGQSDFLVYHAHGGIVLPMIDGFVARPYPEGKERTAINQAFDKFIKTLEVKETEKGVTLARAGEEAPTAVGLQRTNVDRIQDLGKIVEKSMREAGFSQEVIDRVRVELKLDIDIKGADIEQTRSDWKKEGRSLDSVLGATTINRWSALMEVSLAQDINSLQKTVFHEAFHIARRWIFHENVNRQIDARYKTEEGAAEAFADFVSRRSGGQPAPVGAVRRAFIQLRNFFKKMGDFLRGKGWTNPEDIFGKMVAGEYAPHFGRGETTTALQAEQQAAWGNARVGETNIEKAPFQIVEENGEYMVQLPDGAFYEGADKTITHFTTREAAQRAGRNIYGVAGKQTTVHSLPITPEMREKALTEGMTQFKLGRKQAAEASVIDEILPEHTQERAKQALKGVDTGRILDKIKEGAKTFAKTFTPGREHVSMDPRHFGKAYEILRNFKATKQYADRTALDKLREILDPKNMSKRDYELFTLKVALEDLSRELGENGKYANWQAMVEKYGSLQFGFQSADEVNEALEKANRLVDENATVKNALKRRDEITTELLQQVVDAKLLPATVLQDRRYFHHQVLEYLNDRYSTGTGAAAFKVGKKGYQHGRIENVKDYSLAYIESEFEVMAHQINQIEKKKNLDEMKAAYDISKELRDQAKQANYVAVVGGQKNMDRINHLRGLIAEARGMGGLDSGEKAQLKEWADEIRELDPTMPFRQKIAMGYAKLSKALGLNGDEADVDDYAIDMKEIAEYANSTDEAVAIPARSIFKAIGDRNAFIKETLGGRFVTELDLARERKPIEGSKGWTEWVPNQRSAWFLTGSIQDAIAQQIMAGSRELQESDIRPVLARGRDETWIIPAELAQALESDQFNIKQHDTIVSKVAESTLNMWKRWILLNPMRIVKYNLNNTSGDFDIAHAYNPKIFKYAKQSAADLWRWHYDKEMTPALKAEIDKALRDEVIGSGMTVHDIPDVRNQEGLRQLMDAMGVGDRKALRYIERFWQGSKNFTTWRENVLRLAAYRHFKDEIKAGKQVYGASIPAKVDAIEDRDRKAALLSRELVGDYGALSQGGQWLRKKLIPFWSWQEINAPRYYRMFKNLAVEGEPEGRRLRMGAVAAKKTAFLSAKVFALYAAAQMFNHLFWPDEEEELGEVGRRQAHLILGRRDDGSIITVRLQGALSDALSWFGLEDFPEDVREISSGRKSAAKFAGEVALAPVNKLVQGVRPEIKAPGELLTGRTLYPDITKPRPIRDKAEYVAQMLSADSLYRRAAGKPLRGGSVEQRALSDLLSVFTYSADPGETAYYKSRDLVSDYLKENNLERPLADPTNRATALYYYKQAIKFGDSKAAEKYLSQYKELGGNMKGIQMSVKRAHPLGSLPNAHRAKFFNSLDPESRQTIKRGTEWYRETFKGGQS